ncbi:hypothetical protein Ahy_B10g102828 [Arachis hypogaea]|uniref:Uncharacterized protein n=1 Tax=Arachis hypogaea TaxID=3818 RepID=A0A444X2P5_ARAHY|nr:hypothetical protein Ahy_B10g102828 [Arachis hypogaea]
MVMIFANREPEWRCTAAACGAVGSTCGIWPEEREWVGGRDSATVSEWELVCSDKFKIGLVQSLFFVGYMIMTTAARKVEMEKLCIDEIL